MIATETTQTQPLPGDLYTAAQVRELDRSAIEDFGVPGFELMQRAGASALSHLLRRWPLTRSLLIFCGSGNNGGDGYMVAGLARQRGLAVQCVAVGDPGKLKGDARSAWALALEQGVQPILWQSLQAGALTALLGQADLVVDAMLGTGLSGSVRAPYDAAIAAINESRCPVLAVDTPSGISCDSGRLLGSAVEAQLTLTFIGLKQGLLTGDAPDYVGQLMFDDLDVPADVYSPLPVSARRIDWQRMASRLRVRPAASHKGRFGRVLVVGGERGMGGAALMAAEAAVRCGPGLVYLATHPDHVSAALARCPEVMTRGVSHGNELEPMLEAMDVVVIGPGLGRDGWGQQLLQRVLEWPGLCVLDADALNLLSVAEKAPHRENWVLTPHPGEAARLLGRTTTDIGRDRFAAARDLQAKWGGTLVLKGAGTLIQTPQGLAQLAQVGNPGMAKGGMGDVLSGLLGGLLAQPQLREQAVALAVCLHGEAADRAAAVTGQMGLSPRDLIDTVPAVLCQAENQLRAAP